MRMLIRVLGLAMVLCAAACSQAPSTQAPTAQSAAQTALDALTPVIAAEIGAPVTLQPSTQNVSGEWAYIVARPANADGSAIDWSATNLASRYENAVMDESGTVYALLRQEHGAWTVVEHVIAPTDVAWVDWAARHGVPAGVIGTP